MNVYLACFDIQDDKIRRQIGLLLGGFGDRVQESVFEITVKSEAEFERLRQKTLVLLTEGDDLRFYRLCRDCRSGSITAKGRPVARFSAAVVL